MVLGSVLIPAISALILLTLLVRAIVVVRTEKGARLRGSAPGEGHHTIHSEYSSGLSGHHTSYKVPRDPDAYARYFVPRNRKDRP